MLQSEHLVANVVAHLNRNRVLKFEFFAASVLKDRLALFVGTFVFSAPFLMFVYQWEQDQLTTRLAGDFEDVDELL